MARLVRAARRSSLHVFLEYRSGVRVFHGCKGIKVTSLLDIYSLRNRWSSSYTTPVISGVKTGRCCSRHASDYSHSGVFGVVWSFQEKFGHPSHRGGQACLGIELSEQAGHLLLLVVLLLAL